LKGANIENIVLKFKKMSNSERYTQLSVLLEGTLEDHEELSWRSNLCTALREAGVYPELEEVNRDEDPIR
jgi:hypothetical protein